MSRAAIEALGEAIDRALDDAPVTDVLAFVTGVFVGLTLELVRREGHDVNKEIRIDGVEQRDITIHAPKVMQ
ncbi:hypothetical protein KTE71_30595 [Burkholderia multivorans]|jgi:hypothetical protein|uniref:hypothetical protein n=1 Tax=Burkholderia TaxID=32008 RepID=UPI001BA29AA6|nr:MULTISPECIES: hypothetical protein [Burkholderia]MBR8021198.1 hypothetical protein [Burkholderia multivorans]MBU9391846.1 hypothetical protein [Burkholderia multivorans]MBY4669639.1 hypothetical protein [Burkholderia multivorans]MDN7609867.1 hypothetical protein [Burkholderia multivorans]HEF4732692.1 hypothetical protein [Burkholderia multivorans]